jgi:hypothetical protein
VSPVLSLLCREGLIFEEKKINEKIKTKMNYKSVFVGNAPLNIA